MWELREASTLTSLEPHPPPARSLDVAWKVWLTLAAIVAVLVSAGCGTSSGATSNGPAIAFDASAMPSPVSATAQDLTSGQWSTLPPAPIASRDGASVLWTGTELLVWGGASGTEDDQLHADGVAYDPATGRWRLLPAAPLSPRVGQAAVWTGSEMVVWGGRVQQGPDSSEVTADGAAYDPSTNHWQLLPPSPLTARSDTIAVWTGAEMVILGGKSAEAGGSSQSYGDGAAFDPAASQWQALPAPVPPAGHSLSWRTAIQAGSHLLAWSEWAMSITSGPDTGAETGGVDLFDYDELSGRWELIPGTLGALPDVEVALWTGRLAVVRGEPDNCGLCSHPFWAEATALYDPATNRWTAVPADPLQLDGLVSVWTGGALLSFNSDGSVTDGPSGDIVPGDASVYDPAAGSWQRIAPGPFGCEAAAEVTPAWTGHQVLIYCTPSNPPAEAAGLIFTAGA